MATAETNPDPTTTPEQLARREVRTKALAHVITVRLLTKLAKNLKTQKRNSKPKNKHKEV